MILDAFTGIIAAGILCTCFSGAMLLAWRFLFPKRALLLWGTGIGCFATAAFLVALRPFLPVYITITAQNQIFLLGYCFLWWGAASYRNLPPRTLPMLALSLSFFLLLAWFTYVNPLISMRIVILQLYGVIFLICIIRTLLSTTERLTRMEKTTIAALLLDMTMLAATIVTQIIYADYNEPIFRNVISSCYSLLSLITVTSFGLTFFLMILEQMFNEAHRADADSRSTKELLETIIDNIPSLTYLKDRDGRLLACSQGLADMFGVPREQAIGKSSHDFFPAAVADKQQADDLTVLRTGTAVTTEECIESSDGPHYFETVKLPVRGQDGQVTSLCGISTDITERKLAEQALNESSERFMKLLDTVPTVAVQGYELDGTVIYWNKASETMLGYRSDEALGANLLDLIIQPEMREEVMQVIWHTRETGITAPAGEMPLLRKDGSLVPVHSSHALIQTGGNKPVLFCLEIDLSERKLMEEKLLHASDEWRRTFDTISDMIIILDSEHRIVRANRATWQKLGCEIQDLLGRPCYTLFHGLDSPPEFCPHAQLMQSGLAHTEEIFEPQLNCYLDVTVTPLYDPDGKVTGSIHVAHDITGLKLAGEALRESESLYRSILIASPDNITITDLQGTIRMVSPKGLAMFGYQQEELLLGRSLVEFIAPEDRERARANIMRMFQGTYTGPDEYRALRVNGSLIMVETNGDFIIGTDGRPGSMIFVIRDITERKRVAEELNRKNIEIEQFIYTVSHDLRSPLVTVKTFLGYLGQDISTGDSERIAKDMEYIHTAADRMEALLNELLDMSRVGRATTPHEAVTFQKLTAEALDAVAGQISTGKVEVRVGAANPTLCGDRRRLLQIWQNLLDNALKYMGDQASPRIEIGVEQQHGETVFFVRDNGIGIAPEYQEKIFGIFEKLDRRIGGVGMGLTMVKRIVEMYGGHIQVVSAGDGTGSCFRFTLPEAVSGSKG